MGVHLMGVLLTCLVGVNILQVCFSWEICENPTLRTSPISLVDDVNLLTYGTSVEGNCRNFERVHDAC
jgi:hypothetical protein